jgi:hypothetical protein
MGGVFIGGDQGFQNLARLPGLPAPGRYLTDTAIVSGTDTR